MRASVRLYGVVVRPCAPRTARVSCRLTGPLARMTQERQQSLSTQRSLPHRRKNFAGHARRSLDRDWNGMLRVGVTTNEDGHASGRLCAGARRGARMRARRGPTSGVGAAAPLPRDPGAQVPAVLPFRLLRARVRLLQANRQQGPTQCTTRTVPSPCPFPRAHC